MKPNTQHCPICSMTVDPSQRYPRYVCCECKIKASSQDGRALRFYNENMWTGFGAKYVDNGEQYLSHDCYIDGKSQKYMFNMSTKYPCIIRLPPF